MNEHRWHYHDETERRQWQDPEAVMAEIGLERGDTFVDVGCGEGFFTLPAARRAGEQGTVYAVDISSEATSRLQERARKEDIKIVSVRVGTGEDMVLCQACADIVFFGIVLHDFSDPARVLQNARIMVKPAGRLVNLDWKKTPMSIGPPLAKRFSEEQATQLIESAGFKVTAVKDSGIYHYLVTAVPV